MVLKRGRKVKQPLRTAITVRVYNREGTPSDEVSSEDLDFLKELIGDISLQTVTKRALKKYIDDLPDLLIEAQQKDIEQQQVELYRLQKLSERK
ncbi:hypothetical protein PP187_gp332 [Klebsiella phage vB_KvM-Eowyn]|uniref:Uncharacterized protein n=1 Tax=Klebsiella phage vB_KvM-Eowyn TaxID=2762819 RepID=A0A7R8MJX6_9CAUD|nr:hypothetical protein PP187_gp332 [Klebsiella phage vB_KvM-Eowyn]CAD5236321.1 hypothetical protein LLCLJKAH_00332 [Klebsiella phage vB_KvM-Eowyn]